MSAGLTEFGIAPGIASSLQEQLRTVAQDERRFDLVAAYRAQDFFDRPSVSAFSELRKSAEKAKCWPTVKHSLLRFLETGRSPIRTNDKKEQGDWPLPSPEVEPRTSEERHFRPKFPDLPTLIEIAIFEKRPDDVVDLYQRFPKAERWNKEIDKKVAQAVADSCARHLEGHREQPYQPGQTQSLRASDHLLAVDGANLRTQWSIG